MTYHQGFDRLGNQVPPPKPSWHHRAIQALSLACIAGCIFFLLWVHP